MTYKYDHDAKILNIAGLQENANQNHSASCVK